MKTNDEKSIIDLAFGTCKYVRIFVITHNNDLRENSRNCEKTAMYVVAWGQRDSTLFTSDEISGSAQ